MAESSTNGSAPAWKVATIAIQTLAGVAVAVATYTFSQMQALKDDFDERIDLNLINIERIESDRFRMGDGTDLKEMILQNRSVIANQPTREEIRELQDVKDDVLRIGLELERVKWRMENVKDPAR